MKTEQQLEINWGDLPADLTEGFREYHQKNPQVYHRLVALIKGLVQHGNNKIGMGMLFEVLRWEHFMKIDTDEPFKLNNSYRAFYTRLIEKKHPEWTGILTKRKSASDSLEAVA